MTRVMIAAAALLLCLFPALKAEQQRRDPLNDLEVDQLRDAAQDPETRLKLYVQFARARLDKLQQVPAEEKTSDRAEQTRAALQDFADVYDELNINVDTYADRGADLRKALKPVIEADTEFGSKLRAFKASLSNSPQEAEHYDFLISSALEAVDEGAKDHRDLLAEQEQTFKNKKTKDHKEGSRTSE
jgi:predicted  nucleic acid-binding Zn-ribbon protein